MFQPPAKRPLPDIRDDEEKADVPRILAVLRPERPVRHAHDRGADFAPGRRSRPRWSAHAGLPGRLEPRNAAQTTFRGGLR